MSVSIGDQSGLREVHLTGGRMSILDVGGGPAVLLGHGFLWDHAMWEPQIAALSRHCRVIVPDMWGHGGSDPLPLGTRGLSDLAGHMLELLDRLAIDRCVVAGSSLGGMWGAHLAARAPNRVAGLVILNSFLGEEPSAKRAGYAAILDQVGAEGAIAAHLADRIVPLFFTPGIEATQPALPDDLRRRITALGPETLRRSIVPLGRIIFDRADAMAMLPLIEAPTLVVAGADDLARPAPESRAMAEMLGCALTIIPGCGHSATLEKPEAVNEALLTILHDLGWTDAAPA
jgi:pimeloyl-ACP methyl ester carboxylesterase